MDDYNAYLECFIQAIKDKKEISLDFEYPKWYEKWYEFHYVTDIGFMLQHNEYMEYRGPATDNEVKGVFIKIDDNFYAQISFHDVESTKKTNVHIEFFDSSKLKEKVDIAFEYYKDNKYNMYLNKSEIEEAIKGFDPFEVIVHPIKKRR